MHEEAVKVIDYYLGKLGPYDGNVALAGRAIGDGGLRYLSHRLSSDDGALAAAISQLHIGSCQLTDAAIPDLLDILGKTHALEALILPANQFSAEGLAKLTPAIGQLPHLKKIDLSHNHLGPAGGSVAAGFIAASGSLQDLQAHNMGLRDAGLSAVAKAVADAPSMRRINLFSNQGTPACEPALRELINGHRYLTHVHLAQQHVPLDDALSKAFAASPNVNQLYATPSNDPHVSARCQYNLRHARRAAQLISRATPEQLGFDDYAFVARRFSSAQEPELLRNTVGFPVRVTAARFEEFFARMPGLPPAGPGFAEALFRPNEHGFAPLDNPRIWHPPGACFERLESSGAPLTEQFRKRRTGKGQSFLSSAGAMLSPAELLAPLNRKGIRLGAGELLAPEGKPNGILRAFIEQGILEPLFSLENWYGREPSELQKLYDALPDELQSSIPLQLLRHQMQIPGKNSIGR